MYHVGTTDFLISDPSEEMPMVFLLDLIRAQILSICLKSRYQLDFVTIFIERINFQQSVFRKPVLTVLGGRSHILKANFGYLCHLPSTQYLDPPPLK